jgi:hypothetical protein
VKKGRKANGEQAKDMVKSTYLMDPVLKENLAYVALAERKDQSDLVREAIEGLLISKGLDPNRPPTYNIRSRT